MSTNLHPIQSAQQNQPVIIPSDKSNTENTIQKVSDLNLEAFRKSTCSHRRRGSDIDHDPELFEISVFLLGNTVCALGLDTQEQSLVPSSYGKTKKCSSSIKSSSRKSPISNLYKAKYNLRSSGKKSRHKKI